MSLKKEEWDLSYLNKDNFVFYPQEEIIRFAAKYVAKRVGLEEVNYIANNQSKVLDLGCGIGRHIIFFEKLGIDTYGIDLSEQAITVAHKWLYKENIQVENKLVNGSADNLPWEDETFDFIVSHGVLDSMSFDIAQKVVEECQRVIKKGGLFYCDLIGEDSEYGNGFEEEVVVEKMHEKGTIQSYFTVNKIKNLFDGFFEIRDIRHIINRDCITGNYFSRYHVVLKR